MRRLVAALFVLMLFFIDLHHWLLDAGKGMLLSFS
jgi:hypothetical protein